MTENATTGIALHLTLEQAARLLAAIEQDDICGDQAALDVVCEAIQAGGLREAVSS